MWQWIEEYGKGLRNMGIDWEIYGWITKWDKQVRIEGMVHGRREWMIKE